MIFFTDPSMQREIDMHISRGEATFSVLLVWLVNSLNVTQKCQSTGIVFSYNILLQFTATDGFFWDLDANNSNLETVKLPNQVPKHRSCDNWREFFLEICGMLLTIDIHCPQTIRLFIFIWMHWLHHNSNSIFWAGSD